MRRTLLAAFLLAFAGCAQGPGPSQDAGAPQTLDEAPPRLEASTVLDAHVRFVTENPARYGQGPDHLGARAWLKAFLDSLEGQRWDVGAGATQNICLFRPGLDPQAAWVVVAGHYDTAAAALQGAYDNGLGAVMAMQLAAAFDGWPGNRPTLYCALDGGDAGYTGSTLLLEELQADGTPIHAALFLDGFGMCWPIEVPLRVVHNDEALAALADQQRRRIGVPDRLYREQPTVFGAQLDATPWAQAGVPFLLPMCAIEDTPGLAGAPAHEGVGYPFLHLGDTVESMTATAGGGDALAAGVQSSLDLASAILAELVNAP